MPDLFPETNNSFKSRLRKAVEHLAVNGIFIGTSSWKYRGWTGLLYDEQRYCYRGKFAESRFERDCLAEYAETFKTVCVDAAYYQFPSTKYLEGLVSKVPSDFKFGFKVTDDITLKRFTNLPRFGSKAGKPNEHFLDADLFSRCFQCVHDGPFCFTDGEVSEVRWVTRQELTELMAAEPFVPDNPAVLLPLLRWP